MEIVLREVLEVLQKHNIPIETASLNVSLFDAAFDEHIPQLKNHKAGIFHRPVVIDSVPMLFQAQRRYPFNKIVRLLEDEIRPSVEGLASALQQEYPDFKIAFVSVTQSPAPPRSYYLHTYRLGMNCRFSDDAHADYNELDLAIFLQQTDDTTYPRIRAWVGWLVDEESGGEWGVDIKYDALFSSLDYAPHHIDLLKKALPGYFTSFRAEIARKLSGELDVEDAEDDEEV
ncbi:MAG TPA: hypothetical protein VKB76_18915 [Ktedonobacterales bacterium]|nr:hypothetical protein [Ktedonobacterales bacterium]